VQPLGCVYPQTGSLVPHLVWDWFLPINTLAGQTLGWGSSPHGCDTRCDPPPCVPFGVPWPRREPRVGMVLDRSQPPPVPARVMPTTRVLDVVASAVPRAQTVPPSVPPTGVPDGAPSERPDGSQTAVACQGRAPDEPLVTDVDGVPIDDWRDRSPETTLWVHLSMVRYWTDMRPANDEHVTEVSVTSLQEYAKAPCMGRKVENEDAVVLASGHARFEGALRGARKGTFDDGFHRLPMLLAREAVTQASAANPLDGSRIVEAIGLQWVAENVKAMAAMDVVLAAVVVRDELANDRLAALKSDAERAAYLPKVSMKDAKERAQQMSALGVLGSKMSQERTYIWWAVVMWCKSWLVWHLCHARRTGGTPVDTRLWELLLFMGHRLDL